MCLVTFLAILYCLASRVFCKQFQSEMFIAYIPKQINMNLTFYDVGCCCIAAVWKLNIQWVAPKVNANYLKIIYTVSPTLNLTLNLTDRLTKANVRYKEICWSNHGVLAWLSLSAVYLRLVFDGTRSTSQLQCCTRGATEQVYYTRKAIHMELFMWAHT